jgi:hypothetical protein
MILEARERDRQLVIQYREPNEFPLSHFREKRLLSLTAERFAETLTFAVDHWTGNPQPVTVKDIETIFYRLSARLKPADRSLPYDHNKMKTTLSYIQSTREHAVISAALLACPLLDEPSFANRLVLAVCASIFLAKSGFSFRQMVSYSTMFLTPTREEKAALDLTRANNNITPYITYIARSIRIKLIKLSDILRSETLPTRKEQTILNERDWEILSFFSQAHPSITNSKVRKKLKLSQVTTSRVLSRLVSLGEIASHGQGRAVYYTKI